MDSNQQDIIPIVYDNLEKVCKDRILITPNKNGLFIIHEPKDVADVDYMDFAEKMYFEIAYPKSMLLFRNHSLTKDFPIEFIDSFTRKKIAEDFRNWDKQQVLQPFLLELLTKGVNKKTQINILKGKYINSQQIHAFFREAAKLGYTYSQYFFTNIPKDYDKDKIPSFAYIHGDGQVEKYGTNISDKAVVNLVEKQKRTFVRFTTKGESWHCIISDLSSITGRERGKKFGGISHMHYISDKFGINKTSLIDSLQYHDHPSCAYHIRLNNDN